MGPSDRLVPHALPYRRRVKRPRTVNRTDSGDADDPSNPADPPNADEPANVGDPSNADEPPNPNEPSNPGEPTSGDGPPGAEETPIDEEPTAPNPPVKRKRGRPRKTEVQKAAPRTYMELHRKVGRQAGSGTGRLVRCAHGPEDIIMLN